MQYSALVRMYALTEGIVGPADLVCMLCRAHSVFWKGERRESQQRARREVFDVDRSRADDSAAVGSFATPMLPTYSAADSQDHALPAVHLQGQT